MKVIRAIVTLTALAVVCHVQAINFSGIVKNSEGSGVAGVTVRLGKAALSTTTGTDGSFTLKDGTGATGRSFHTTFNDACPFFVENDRLFFNGSQQANVHVAIYDCNGKLLLSRGHVISSRNNSIPLPHFGSGVELVRVSINHDVYSLKQVIGTPTNHAFMPSGKNPGLSKQAKVTILIDDALLFIKAGYQLTRLAVTNPDSSGLQIAMAPLVTGTVTDADGNAYQTVKIGNQEWTTENLRTTKFNDGASIGSACTFYKNVTDAAAKKKWGALYEFSAVKTGKLAPTGWQVPTSADWDTLQNYLITHGYNYDGTTTDNKIAKSMSATSDWDTTSEKGGIGNNLSINNASGFSALPAGWRYWSGNEYKDQKSHAYWWTSSPRDGTYSYIADLWNINFDLDRTYYTLVQCSVRLVRHN
jgi:uncharacterized protein (TIGR02145 family)